MKKYFGFIILIAILITACIKVPKQFEGLTPGNWRGIFILKDLRQTIITKGKDEVITTDVSTDKKYFTAPFNFSIIQNEKKELVFEVKNADEKIQFYPILFGKDIRTGDDTFYIDLAPYDAHIKGLFDIDQLKGHFIVRDKKNYSIPFEARFGQEFRFEKLPQKATIDINGNWQIEFGKDSNEAFDGIGEFVQNGNQLKGTFRTETGDFRYLEGLVAGDKVKLSCFDGSHVFLFDAMMDGDSLRGIFYSGVHYQVPFVGYRSSNPILQAADTITKIISDKPFEFKFEDSEGNLVSNADPKYSNKIKIIQITGSWCPNCKDESEFLQSYLQSNPSDELAVFALAFERHKERDKALERIRNYKKHMNINYPVLRAGIANRDSASAIIPQINGIKAYPTMLFLNRKNQIVKVHTGFDGPATSMYESFKKEFANTISELIKSK